MAENDLFNQLPKIDSRCDIKRQALNPFSLDAINFLLADVRGALGPYLNVFLVTQRHWSQTEVGLVTTLGGLLGLAAQTPIGGVIDATRAKRGVIVLALVVLAIGAITIFALPSFWPVTIANGLMAVVGDVFGPAVAALTLGLYARNQLTPLVIADIMRGTGRYNLAQGAIATMQGIGASLSGLAAGEIVDHFGYSPTFLILGGAALVALIVFAIQMPETVERRQAPTEKALSRS